PWDLIAISPHPSPTLVGSECCKQSGYLKWCPFSGVLRATKSYQILPFFTKNVQKRTRTGMLRAVNRGFSGLILLKRVKSRGSCQVATGSPLRLQKKTKETAEGL